MHLEGCSYIPNSQLNLPVYPHRNRVVVFLSSRSRKLSTSRTLSRRNPGPYASLLSMLQRSDSPTRRAHPCSKLATTGFRGFSHRGQLLVGRIDWLHLLLCNTSYGRLKTRKLTLDWYLGHYINDPFWLRTFEKGTRQNGYVNVSYDVSSILKFGRSLIYWRAVAGST